MTNPPPEGDPDVASFVWELFETARDERERLGMPDRWRLNYDLYRGKHFSQKRNNQMVELNLFFANVERTRANITARNPVFEVVDMDGQEDEADRALTSYGKKWWKDTKQKKKLSSTALNMEIYGATIEKPYWNARLKKGDVAVLDPYSFFPAPGYFEDISRDAPYVCHAYPDQTEAIEQMYGVKGVKPSDVYSLLGEDREDSRPMPANTRPGSSTHYANNANIVHAEFSGRNYRERRALVVEVWLRDYSVEEYYPIIAKDTETGAAIKSKDPRHRLKYPGGIRVVTVTNEGELLLNDMANPNVNPNIKRSMAKQTFLYDRFPFAKANSYSDTTSVWGFSAAEQVGDLNYKIDTLFSRLFGWASRTMFPPFVIPKDTGIPKSAVNNKPNLVLQPETTNAAAGIGFVQVPSPPAQFFTFIDYLMNLYDRIYQIEDADRGETPGSVTAASAIVALQERNAVLIQQKISSVDELIEFRGQALVSFLQNFGTWTEQTEISNEPVKFRGVELMGRRFNFVVEAGSTMPKTTLQVKEEAKEFYQMGVIDRQALLEISEFPNAKEILERIGEGQLNQALQILIQAGMPEEHAMQIRDALMQTQGGPGNRQQGQGQGGSQKAPQSGQTKPGTPRAKQGQQPETARA